MSKVSERPPSQATPARTIAVTKFTSVDIFVGSTRVALSQCSPRFISLLSERLNAYRPPHFEAVAALQPWPNNNLISGFIDNAVAIPGPAGRYTFELPIYLESGMAGNGNVIVNDLHNLTASGSITDPPSDPDGLFDALTPILTKAFDSLVAQFALSPNFPNYDWGSTVLKVDQQDSTVTIAGGHAQNVQPGNAFEVARVQGTPGVYNPVALVEVTSVLEQSSLCSYFGGGNHDVTVQDSVFIYQVGRSYLRDSRSLTRNRVSGPRQLVSGSGLPIELGISMTFSDGMDTTETALDPPTMVGPPQVGQSFAVQYISIFARVPQGQQVHCMINGGNAGGHWFALFPQGTFAGFDVYVCSQLVAFVIAPTGIRTVAATRSQTVGNGIVDVHFTGSFSN